MTDEDLRWCDVCDDCSHYKAVGDEKYQCTLEGGRCRGYFAYKKLKAENAALRERLSRAVELPCAKVVKTKEWIDRVEVGDIIWEWAVIYIDRQGEFVVDPCRSKIAAETRLKELQGGK